jgi:hypothetical protein
MVQVSQPHVNKHFYSKEGEARKETGCVLMTRQGEGMTMQRDKT